MAQQSSLTFFENANSQPDFTVVLRGYDRPQVDDFVQRLNAALAQSEAARAEAEQRLNEAQRRARNAEQALTREIKEQILSTNAQRLYGITADVLPDRSWVTNAAAELELAITRP